MPPLPPELANLPTITAEPWCLIDPGAAMMLEGPAFDREGNLFVTSPSHGKVIRITPHGDIDTVLTEQHLAPCGSAFHKDGRLFVVCLSGAVVIVAPDGAVTRLRPTCGNKELSINDLVFDKRGYAYITDFTGTVAEPTGGLYRLSPSGETVEPVCLHLASPNGVSLSPAGDVLWVAETTRNSVLRVAILEDGVTTSPVSRPTIAYYSCGCPGPDSNKVDAEGRLYQCVMGQGRIVILDAAGIPVANVVVAGREDGKLLRTTNLAFRPGTNEGFVTTSGVGGAWVCTFVGLARGLDLFSHATA